MILSVSRRTDIPNYYGEWFINRIKEGYLYVRNPINIHQVSQIDISPEKIDCIVFWTKNPESMITYLNQLEEYPYYFQFSLTGYGKDIEPLFPHKKDKMIPIFQRLSKEIGKEKVIWRYDPILFTEIYSKEYHLKAFAEIASCLRGYSEKVVISFVDLYEKTKRNMKGISMIEKESKELVDFAKELAKISKDNKMKVETCGEQIDLSSFGIKHGSCIDKELIEKIAGYKIKTQKDKNQREECRCVESVDIGAYNTCLNGCRYCYANYSKEKVTASRDLYDPNSPILCDKITKEDKITKRVGESLRQMQIGFFD